MNQDTDPTTTVNTDRTHSTRDGAEEQFGEIVESTTLEAATQDAVLVGEPADSGASGRAGAREGPAAIRAALAEVRTHHFDAGPVTSVGDLGDVEVPTGESASAVQETVREVAAAVHETDSLPVFLGGDGSLTYANVAPLLSERVADGGYVTDGGFGNDEQEEVGEVEHFDPTGGADDDQDDGATDSDDGETETVEMEEEIVGGELGAGPERKEDDDSEGDAAETEEDGQEDGETSDTDDTAEAEDTESADEAEGDDDDDTEEDAEREGDDETVEEAQGSDDEGGESEAEEDGEGETDEDVGDEAEEDDHQDEGEEGSEDESEGSEKEDDDQDDADGDDAPGEVETIESASVTPAAGAGTADETGGDDGGAETEGRDSATADERVGMVRLSAHLGCRPVDGQPSSASVGRQLLTAGLDALAVVGARHFESTTSEAEYLREHGGEVVTAEEVGDDPVAAADRALDAMDGTNAVYLSVDLSVLDVTAAPGVATPTPGGITSRELFRLVRMLAADDRLAGLEVVGTAPSLCSDGRSSRAAARAIAHALSVA